MKKIKAEVTDNKAVINTGAVERYFKKSLIIPNYTYYFN
jgi:hypothetical protein